MSGVHFSYFTDGYDLQWGTNTLGHAHFTLCLIPALLEGAKTSSDGRSRVINLSSDAAYGSGINWDTLKDGPERRKLSPLGLYFQSKFVKLFECLGIQPYYLILTRLLTGKLRLLLRAGKALW